MIDTDAERKMAAPDFSKVTSETLATRAAWRCSNPDCDILTAGPHSAEDKKLTIGEAAHIYGARPSERRYRPDMTDTERATISNGIWLCRNCHGEIDKDPARFSPELLFRWKNAHERKILEQIGTAGDKLRSAVEDALLARFSHLPAFVREIIRDKPDYWEFLLTSELLDHYCAPVLRRGRDLQRGLTLKTMTMLPPEQFMRWLDKKPKELLAVPPAIEGLIEDLPRAWGEPGKPGDEREIDHVCKLFAGVIEHVVDVAEDTKFTTVPQGFEGVRELLTEGALHILKRFPELPNFLKKIVAEAPKEGVFEFTLVIDLPALWSQRMESELEKGLLAFQKRGGEW